MKKILFLSNGHGEDLVAAEIAKNLSAESSPTFFPLVKKDSPSGGFALRNFRFLAADIYAGLIGQTIGNFKQLRKLKGTFDLTVAIGDIVPLLGALLVGAPFIFVGVNKSAYYRSFGSGYTPWELWLLKKYAKKVFARDRVTAETYGFDYVGNPLMDGLGKTSEVQGPRSKVTIGFLPGTRSDASTNLNDFAKIAKEIGNKAEYLVATRENDVPPGFTKVSFDKLLASVDLVIGLSGTGNEQAAGVGLPVVSFFGRGSQYNQRFAEAQKELLGEALLLVHGRFPSLVASAVCQLLNDPDKMKNMEKVGRARMGERGAAKKIAEYVAANL